MSEAELQALVDLGATIANLIQRAVAARSADDAAAAAQIRADAAKAARDYAEARDGLAGRLGANDRRADEVLDEGP